MEKTILAIDDDAVLMFYKAALADLATVRVASNLSDAGKQLAGVDLIILDFDLEQDQTRFQDLVPTLVKAAPVLLCSGVQDLRVPALGTSLGIAGYWNKSSDREGLRALVKSNLHSRDAAK